MDRRQLLLPALMLAAEWIAASDPRGTPVRACTLADAYNESGGRPRVRARPEGRTGALVWDMGRAVASSKATQTD